MSGCWFYGHDANKNGPCSDQELRDLADAGQILPTDTIWKEGIEKGVTARRVKNLFAPASDGESLPQAPSSPTASETAPVAPSETSLSPTSLEEPPQPLDTQETDPARATTELDKSPLESLIPPPPQPDLYTSHAKKGRAVAGKGAVIVGQNGTHVHIIKKCTVCGHQDYSRSTMPIRNGTNRIGFFCPKCRKRREVEFQGFSS